MGRVDDAAALAAGRMLGRYELVARLGAGAMGVVWEARDPQLDRRVAIKVVHPELARSSDASGRLLREARAMAKLSHRAVITIYDAGETDDVLFIALGDDSTFHSIPFHSIPFHSIPFHSIPFWEAGPVEGNTLGALLRNRSERARADWRRWLRVMIEAGTGLAAAHRGGVLHRDFKPDNVLIDRAGRVCVGDFGLATLGEAALAGASLAMTAATTHLDLTTTGALLGTPVYMSPQQLRGEPIDARADQFAFCVALHEALYDVRPFAVTSEGFDAIPALAEQIELGKLPAVASEVPDAVREVLHRGLAADPEARWPDMDALLAALVRAARPRRWWPWLAGAGAIAAIAVAVGLAVRTPAVPTTAGVVTAAHMTALFELTSRGRVAVSADGRYLAIGTDHVEVRAVAGPDRWTLALDGRGDVSTIEFDGDSVRFWRPGRGIARWRFATERTSATEIATIDGQWCGRTPRGDLVYRPGPSPAFAVVANGADVEVHRIAAPASVFVLSPDRTRLAYLEVAGRYGGQIVVRDLARGTELRSGSLVDPTALAWLDDATVIYATESVTLPTIHRVAVGPGGLGTPTILFTSDAGWFGLLASGGGQTFAVVMHTSTRTRLVESGGIVRDLDRSSVGAALAWASPDELYTWSRIAGRIERRGEQGSAPTAIPLLDEPANATLAGDTLIVTTRRSGGRDTTAYALADGTQLWRHEGGTAVARCAGDRHAPCFAVRTVGGTDRIVSLDPRTGELGQKPIREGHIEDIAVRDDGARILVAGAARLPEIDLEGVQQREFVTTLSSTRSVVYDPVSPTDPIVAGTLFSNTYEVGRFRGDVYTAVVQTESDILSFVRLDPTGKRISFLARIYAPEVSQLQLPR